MRDEPVVTVATFGSSFEASLARGALEAVGIRAMIPGEGLGTFCRTQGDVSARTLQVFASDYDRAVAELRRATMRAANTVPRATSPPLSQPPFGGLFIRSSAIYFPYKIWARGASLSPGNQHPKTSNQRNLR